MDINEKTTAVITGGSSGIGLGIVEYICSNGGRVVILDIAPPPEAYIDYHVDLDITDHQKVMQAIRVICESGTHVDYLINCAGVNGSYGGAWDITQDQYQWVFDVNFFAACNLISCFMSYYKNPNNIHIINVTSHLSLLTRADMSPYIASKHALLAYSESLQADIYKQKRYNYKVHVFIPYFVQSKIYNSERYGYKVLIQDGSKSLVDTIKQQVDNGMNAIDSAKCLFEGIDKNVFYICTDPVTREQFRKRAAAICDPGFEGNHFST